MKVAIIETEHFQYGLTQSELFEGEEKFFFVTKVMYDKMHEYNPALCNGKFHVISGLDEEYDKVIDVCKEENIEVLLLSPIFKGFKGALKIAENLTCQKVITIHNLNFWLNARFRTHKYYKERKLKQKIVANFDYIAVEDFMFNYIRNNDKSLFKKYKFLYIPFTIFHKCVEKKFHKENNRLKIVLTGSIHKDRRRYEDVIETIHYFAKNRANITFSFAGRPLEDYGKWVVSELDKANKIHPGIAEYFPIEGLITPDMFLKEMETSDLVLSTSTTEFKALGTTEYIGKTKPTAAIHDMMSFELPGLLPAHLIVPENLKGSVFNYAGADELKGILQNLLDKPELLKDWKKQATINSTYFTAAEIRKNLPFFYTQCKRCVMDNANDPNIWFDKEGNCNYCNDDYTYIQSESNVNIKKPESLTRLITKIKEDGATKKYDCVVGVSGGLDSAYLVYKLVKLGVRPIAVHFDNGWNSEVATQNIETLLKKLNVDLYTYVCDWEEFKDLQMSFLKAGVVDIELVTDHAISATMYDAAKKFNTKYIFQGHNQSSEFILPEAWIHWKNDALNIKSIHKKYGSVSLKTLPLLTFFKEYYHLKYRKTNYIYLLDYIDYNKKEAELILKEEFGWKNYGAKHNESIFTRFYQNYILPKKFNIDKRKAHLSSLICSNQITREEALEELKTRCWETDETKQDKAYVLKKLGVSEKVFDAWMAETPVSHLDFASYLTRHNQIITALKKLIGKR